MMSTKPAADTVAVPGFVIYAFPVGSINLDTEPYFMVSHKATGYAEYIGDWPISEVPQNMREAYPGCDYQSSPRTWQIPEHEIDEELRAWLDSYRW